MYLLRNESRKGIGFFEANNFYPDFILWVNNHNRQNVIFIDPKGITHLKGLNDPKIQLFRILNTEIQRSLNDPNIVLDSYIISNTKYIDVNHWGSKNEFKKNHILFQTEKTYLEDLFKSILFSYGES